MRKYDWRQADRLIRWKNVGDYVEDQSGPFGTIQRSDLIVEKLIDDSLKGRQAKFIN